jgi:hypothetical protein
MLLSAAVLLAAPLALLAVLLIVVLWGPERTYLRMLELIRALRGGCGSRCGLIEGYVVNLDMEQQAVGTAGARGVLADIP